MYQLVFTQLIFILLESLQVYENKNCTKSILRWQFQMFYHKVAVMDTLVLKPCFLGLYAPLCIHPSGSVLLLVNIWNCQRQYLIDYLIFKHILDIEDSFLYNIYNFKWLEEICLI